MTNEQLVARIQSGEDVGNNMELLYGQVKNFIRSIAWQYRDSGEMEDLEQEGYLALYPAIDNFDPGAGCKFLTYAGSWIRQAMRRYLQNCGGCVRLPAHCLEQVKKMQKYQTEYSRQHGREPSDAEICRFMGLTLEQVEGLWENACMMNLRSLEAPVTGRDGSEDATAGDLVASAEDLEENVIERIQREECSREVWACVDELEPEQAAIIRARYQYSATLEQAGQLCGLTASEARTKQSKAIRRLRKWDYRERLARFLPEYEEIYGDGLRGNGVERFQRTWTSSTERAALHLVERCF